MEDPVVGRDASLELALAALGTPGRVLLEGPAGIGRTALLGALAAGDG